MRNLTTFETPNGLKFDIDSPYRALHRIDFYCKLDFYWVLQRTFYFSNMDSPLTSSKNTTTTLILDYIDYKQPATLEQLPINKRQLARKEAKRQYWKRHESKLTYYVNLYTGKKILTASNLAISQLPNSLIRWEYGYCNRKVRADKYFSHTTPHGADVPIYILFSTVSWLRRVHPRERYTGKTIKCFCGKIAYEFKKICKCTFVECPLHREVALSECTCTTKDIYYTDFSLRHDLAYYLDLITNQINAHSTFFWRDMFSTFVKPVVSTKTWKSNSDLILEQFFDKKKRKFNSYSIWDNNTFVSTQPLPMLRVRSQGLFTSQKLEDEIGRTLTVIQDATARTSQAAEVFEDALENVSGPASRLLTKAEDLVNNIAPIAQHYQQRASAAVENLEQTWLNQDWTRYFGVGSRFGLLLVEIITEHDLSLRRAVLYIGRILIEIFELAYKKITTSVMEVISSFLTTIATSPPPNQAQGSNGITVVAQGSSGLSNFFSSLIHLIGSTICELPKPTLAKFEVACRRFTVFERALTSGKHLVSWLMEHLPKWLQVGCFMNGKQFWSEAARSGYVQELVSKCHEFLMRHQEGKPFDSPLYTEIMRLAQKYDNDILEHPEIPTALGFVVRSAVTKVWDIKTPVTSRTQEPMVIYLYGGPGVGKSTFVRIMSEILLHHIGHNDTTVSNKTVYYRGKTDFWDGYNQQPIVVYDDFGQHREEEDYTELISLVTNNAQPLNFDRLENKGSGFNSKIIILCSNIQYPQPVTLLSKEAIQRRRDICVEVRSVGPKDPTLYSNLRFKTFPAIEPSSRFETNSEFIPRAFSAKDFCTFVCDSYTSKYAALDALTKDNTFVKDFLSARVVPQGLLSNANAVVKYCKALCKDAVDDIEILLNEEGLYGLLTKRILPLVSMLSVTVCLVQTARMYSLAIEDALRGNNDDRTGLRSLEVDGVVVQSFEHRQVKSKLQRAAKKPKFMRKVHPQLQQGDVEMLNAYTPATITRKINENSVYTMNCIPLAGRLLLVNSHFFSKHHQMKSGEALTIKLIRKGNVTTHEVLYREENLFEYEDVENDHASRDMCLFMCDNLPPQKDIVSWFVPENELRKYEIGHGTLVTTHNDLLMNYHASYSLLYQPAALAEVDGRRIVEPASVTYDIATTDGCCGSPFFTTGLGGQHRIISMHYGILDGKTGMGALLTFEDIKNMISQIPRDVSRRAMLSYIHEPIDKPGTTIDLQGNFKKVGTVTKGVHQPSKTSIIKSPIFELVQLDGSIVMHQTEPSVLTTRDPRYEGVPCNLVAEQFAKYGSPIGRFDPKIAEAVYTFMEEQVLLWKKIPGVYKCDRVLTLEEGINGNAYPFIDRLNMASSPGYPYVTYSPGRKEKLFSLKDDMYSIRDEELRRIYDTKTSLLAGGKLYPSVWINSLKDERRSLGKLPSGNTRVFTCAPLETTLLLRQYFLGFNSFIMQTRLHNPFAMGMDPYSSEWDNMVSILVRNSKEGMDFDYKKFDGKVPYEGMVAMLRMCSAYYESQGDFERYGLMTELQHTYCIINNEIFQKFQGNPSGCAITTTLNSITNWFYMCYCWLKLAPTWMRDLSIMKQYVSMFFFGDDGILSVAEVATPFFNFLEVQKVLTEIGITITPADKLGLAYTVNNVMSLTFLKNSINKLNNRYVALLDKTTIMEMCYWITKSVRKEEGTLDNVNTALRFLYFYGKEEFEKYRKAFFFALVKGLQTSHIDLHTYDYLDSIFTEKLDFGTFGTLVPYASSKKLLFGKDTELYQVVPQGNEQIMENLNMTNESENFENTQTSDLAEGQGYVENRVGAITIDQSKAQVSKPNFGYVTNDNQRAVTHIDSAWNLEELIGRWNVVETVTWKSADAEGTLLALIPIPHGILSTAAAATPFKNFQLSRYAVTLKLQSNSTAFYQGMLIGFVIPMMGESTLLTRFDNKAVQTSMNHVFVEAKESTTVEIEIPFTFMQDYYNIEFLESDPSFAMAHFALKVFTPLTTVSSATPSVELTIYSKVDATEFHVPAVIAPPARYNATPRKKFAIAKKTQELQVKPQGLMSFMSKSFDRILDRIKPEEIISDAIGKFGSMDKPNNSANPLPLVTRLEQYLTHGQNIENIPRLALYPGAMNLSDSEHFSTTSDEMAIKSMTSKVTWYKSAAWAATDVTGTVLFKDYVGPVIGAIPSSVGTSAIPLTTLDYTSLPFSRWRGGIKYRIMVVCSGFHGGRLMFSYHPNSDQDDEAILDANLEARSSQYFAVLDLKTGRNTFELVCPYLSPTSWKEVYNGATSIDYNNFSTGLFYVSVLNPLIAPSNVASSVRIEIFVGGADDYALNVLNHNNITFSTVAPPAVFEREGYEILVEPQGKTSGTKELEKQTKENVTSTAVDNSAQKDLKNPNDVILASGPAYTRDPALPRYPHFSEKYDSLGDIFKRHSPGVAISIPQTLTPAQAEEVYSETTPLITVIPISNLLTQVASGLYSYRAKPGRLTYYLNAFRMYRGSIRVKILTNVMAFQTAGSTVTPNPLAIDFQAVTFTDSSDFVPDTGVPLYGSKYLSLFSTKSPLVANTATSSGPFVRFDGQGSVEVEIPFTSQNGTMLVDQYDEWSSIGYSNYGNIVLATYVQDILASNVTSVNVVANYNVAVATGDDFRCGTWFGTPLVYAHFTSTNVAPAGDQWTKAALANPIQSTNKSDSTHYKYSARVQVPRKI